MTPEERRQQILHNSIGHLPRDVYNYVKLKIFSVDDFTDKAFQLSYSRSKNINTLNTALWIPAWTLKKDNHNNIWMLKTFYDRKAAEAARMKAVGKHWWEVN